MRFVICASMKASAIAAHMAALAGEFTRRGHEAAIVSWGEDDGAPACVAEPRVTLRHFPSPRPTGLKDILFLRRFLAGFQADCVIAHFGAVNAALAAGVLAGVPCRVAWYHTLSGQLALDSRLPAWKRGLLGWRKSLVYRLATQFVANSSCAAGDLAAHFQAPREKIRVLPYALRDPMAAPPAAEGPAEPHVVCAGRLHPSKGQDVLLKAAAKLRARFPRLRVTLAGGGPQQKHLLGLARELGLSGCAGFAGAVSRDEVLRLMASAAVTAVPSRDEAFGLVNVESLAVGTPVVASRVGGIPEIIRDGREGFLVPPEDPDALAAALGRVLENPALRREMSANARARFLSHYELNAACSRQAAWFEEIAS